MKKLLLIPTLFLFVLSSVCTSAEPVSIMEQKREALRQMQLAHRFIEADQYSEGVRILWDLYQAEDDLLLAPEVNPFLKNAFDKNKRLELTTISSFKGQLRYVFAQLSPKGKEISEIL